MGLLLHVEDNSAIRALVRETFRPTPHHVLDALTLEEAASLCEQIPFDVILLDLGLPDGDGMDFLADLQANPATRAIPVIVLSPDPRRIAEAHAFGCSHFLTKPTRAAQLSEAVGRLVPAAV